VVPRPIARRAASIVRRRAKSVLVEPRATLGNLSWPFIHPA